MIVVDPQHLETVVGLLEIAACPDVGCGGKGWIAQQVAAGEWVQEQCQFCIERNDAVTHFRALLPKVPA